MRSQLLSWIAWLGNRLPGILVLAIAVLAFMPSIRWAGSASPVIANAALGLIGVLLVLSGGGVWRMAHLTWREGALRLGERNLARREDEVAALVGLLGIAQLALRNGSVNSLLDCQVTKFHWGGLKNQHFPYVVLDIQIGSRFPLLLTFSDAEDLRFKVEKDTNEVSRRARLVDPQNNWREAEDPSNASTIDIPPMEKLNFYFRFEIPRDVRDEIQEAAGSEAKIECVFRPSWKLEVQGNTLTYTAPLSLPPLVSQIE